ncbi:hypothetical protein VNO77_25943 [Canavalia gladiata]|uniref:Uncharacterized protein n=1 Tax=Canavalia gladiata TaxID=3824 RepID=A0AAN9KRP5_CANGL
MVDSSSSKGESDSQTPSHNHSSSYVWSSQGRHPFQVFQEMEDGAFYALDETLCLPSQLFDVCVSFDRHPNSFFLSYFLRQTRTDGYSAESIPRWFLRQPPSDLR